MRSCALSPSAWLCSFRPLLAASGLRGGGWLRCTGSQGAAVSPTWQDLTGRGQEVYTPELLCRPKGPHQAFPRKASHRLHRLHWGHGPSGGAELYEHSPGWGFPVSFPGGTPRGAPPSLAVLTRPKKLQETSEHPTARLSVRRGRSPRQSIALTQIPGLTFSATWLCP